MRRSCQGLLSSTTVFGTFFFLHAGSDAVLPHFPRTLRLRRHEALAPPSWSERPTSLAFCSARVLFAANARAVLRILRMGRASQWPVSCPFPLQRGRGSLVADAPAPGLLLREPVWHGYDRH
ncbi:hypothetical protein LXA43DRAFT_15955 [Ganoderma leucocontextum]|nr:hypothetical protein LXA43DRAFT_15955 [Ganoderma leucocontextum]